MSSIPRHDRAAGPRLSVTPGYLAPSPCCLPARLVPQGVLIAGTEISACRMPVSTLICMPVHLRHLQGHHVLPLSLRSLAGHQSRPLHMSEATARSGEDRVETRLLGCGTQGLGALGTASLLTAALVQIHSGLRTITKQVTGRCLLWLLPYLPVGSFGA